PALSYAPILVEEPWAYPAATLALWLTVRAVDAPGRWPIALALGSCVIAVLPAIALLAMLAVPRAERDRPGVRAFVVVAAGAVIGFGWYAAVKGAYLSTTFSSLIVERNLVYLAPL